MREISEAAAGDPDDDSEATSYARAMIQNASCANNMKQLGIAMKMFENEQASELFPAGWRTLYPVFILDRAVLTCPSQSPGTESYQIVIPAANAAYFQGLARQVESLPDSKKDAELGHYVPVVIEAHPCGATGGRNALFLDGHVSRIDVDEWEEQIGPYLEYR